MSEVATDLIRALEKLHAHQAVITAEVAQISKDIDTCQLFRERYNASKFKRTIEQLEALKSSKEADLREIDIQLDLFSLHLDAGKRLCRKLDKKGRASEIRTPDQTVIEAESSILAHSPTKSSSRQR
jgi:hypothetical protein